MTKIEPMEEAIRTLVKKITEKRYKCEEKEKEEKIKRTTLGGGVKLGKQKGKFISFSSWLEKLLIADDEERDLRVLHKKKKKGKSPLQ